MLACSGPADLAALSIRIHADTRDHEKQKESAVVRLPPNAAHAVSLSG